MEGRDGRDRRVLERLSVSVLVKTPEVEKD